MKRKQYKGKPHTAKPPADRPKPVIVTDQSKLREVLDELRQAEQFAFDTEFVMEDSYEADVCLIQAATESMVALIDPLAGVDDTGFWELIADESIEKIVHAGAEDLALCVQRTGRIPHNIFDVQIAAGLVGLGYPLSLLKLVRATCGVQLHKSQTLTDWRRRPLSDAQINYAIDDVLYLPSAYQFISRKLEQMGRLDWAREEFVPLEQPETYQRSEVSQLFRLKGSGALDGRGLAIARKLLEAREALAKHFNRPPRALVKDYLIVEIARHQWTTPKQIRSLRGLQLSNAGVRRLAEAVEQGMSAPKETRSETHTLEVDTAQESALISLATALVQSYCHEHDIAPQLAAVKQDNRELVYSFTRRLPIERCRLTNGWRGQIIGPLLTAFFSGEKHVVIQRDGDSIRLRLGKLKMEKREKEGKRQ